MKSLREPTHVGGSGESATIGLIGDTPRIREIRALIQAVAKTDVSVVVQGESGTGKELVANAIHNLGPRSDASFVAVNSSAIPDTLLEAHLFGSRKGSYTGADEDRDGLFQAASKGTLFLDEVGTMSPLFQCKLLRALQEGEILRVGETKPTKVNVRVLAATHLDLESEVRDGTFREDLYYRLSVIDIHVPPLRQRKSDIPLLVDVLLAKHASKFSLERRRISRGALNMLREYSWPGNVRELENVLQRALVIATEPEISCSDIQLRRDPTPATEDAQAHRQSYAEAKATAIDAFQRQYASRLISESGGNITRAAAKAGLTRVALRRILKKHEISFS